MKNKVTPIATQPLTDDEFRRALGRHLLEREGESLRIHTDSEGIPTLGSGFALAVRTKNGLRLRPLSEIEDAVKRGTGNPEFRFDVEELDRLQETVVAVNAGDIAKARKLIPEISTGEERDISLVQSRNRFSFTLDPNRRLDVIAPAMDKAREGAWRSVAAKAREQGWSAAEIEGFKKQFHSSEEMVGLASLKFNMGPNAPIPNTAEAIVTGERARAIYEIEVRSNKNKSRGIANRRIGDAKFLRSGMKERDRQVLDSLRKANAREFDAYRKAFPEAFPEAFSESSPSTGTDQRRFETPPPKPERPGTPATISGDSGDDDLRGGSADDRLSPGDEKLVDALTRPGSPLEDILDKDPADMTEGEVRQVMIARKGAATDAERRDLFAVEQTFFEDKYGTGAVKYDATGKMVPPTPVRPINQTPAPTRGADGRTAAEGLNMLARAVAVPRPGEAAPDVVRALQTGLNILNRARNRPASGRPTFEDLRDDGVPGPKTRRAFKSAARTLGPAKVKEAMALGRFKRYADRPSLADLRAKTEDAFAGLFRKPSSTRPKATQEGFGLQATVNDLGRERLGGAHTPLLEDGDTGRKTEAAFARVLPAAGADAFTSKLGENLGFFDIDDEDGGWGLA